MSTCQFILQTVIYPLLVVIAGSGIVSIISNCWQKCKQKNSSFRDNLKDSDLEKIKKYKKIELIDIGLNPSNMQHFEGGEDFGQHGSYAFFGNKSKSICLRFQNPEKIYINKSNEDCWRLSGTFTVTKINKKGTELLLTAR